MVSLDLPHVVLVRLLSMGIVLLALSLVVSMCLLKLSFGSSVSPSIFGFLFVGMVWLLIFRLSFVLYSAGSGVKRVDEDLSGLRIKLFSVVHVCIVSRYGCSWF